MAGHVGRPAVLKFTSPQTNLGSILGETEGNETVLEMETCECVWQPGATPKNRHSSCTAKPRHGASPGDGRARLRCRRTPTVHRQGKQSTVATTKDLLL